LFCTGLSGTGKSHFIKNYLCDTAFYNLKSATTRPMRQGEQDGREYYFRDENWFDSQQFATKLWVNEHFWKPGEPKWLYGVTEQEIFDNLGHNFSYDIIQPKYAGQMIKWFRGKHLDNYYGFKILWFQPWQNRSAIIEQRQNMPNDILVRKANTCNMQDFKAAHLAPDFIVLNNPEKQKIDDGLKRFIQKLVAEYSQNK